MVSSCFLSSTVLSTVNFRPTTVASLRPPLSNYVDDTLRLTAVAKFSTSIVLDRVPEESTLILAVSEFSENTLYVILKGKLVL